MNIINIIIINININIINNIINIIFIILMIIITNINDDKLLFIYYIIIHI
jgi:hypothetical protein